MPAKNNDLQVKYHGALFSGTGYAEAARNAVLALHQAGVKIQVNASGFSKAVISHFPRKISGYRYEVNRALKFPYELCELLGKLKNIDIDKNAPMVVHAPSPVYKNHIGGKRRTIGYTAWETNVMPQHWVDGCNLVDEVWIPSFHNLQALRDSGVIKPIYVVPHAIDTERFAPSPLRLNGRFTFLSVFRWGLRKGWPELLAAYERAFTADDPVTLRILTNFREDSHKAEADMMIDHFKQPGKPKLEILPLEYVTYDFMPILYQNADVFVLPSRGEGFCLPCAEAMACGLPAIVTNSTAFLDYVDDQNGYPVAYRVETADDSTDPDRDKTAWTITDIDDLAANMRIAAFHDPEELKQKGELARQTIIEKYSFAPVARIMIERLAANA